jgi:hypothetical protein
VTLLLAATANINTTLIRLLFDNATDSYAGYPVRTSADLSAVLTEGYHGFPKSLWVTTVEDRLSGMSGT